MLEMTVAASIMLALLAGTFRFGYTFYAYNQLVTSIGNGARYAAQRTYRSATPGDIEKGAASIRNMVVYGDPIPEPGTQPVAAGLKPENIEVTWNLDDSNRPEAVVVTVVNYRAEALFGSFEINRRPLVQFPFVGRYAPTEHEP